MQFIKLLFLLIGVIAGAFAGTPKYQLRAVSSRRTPGAYPLNQQALRQCGTSDTIGVCSIENVVSNFTFTMVPNPGNAQQFELVEAVKEKPKQLVYTSDAERRYGQYGTLILLEKDSEAKGQLPGYNTDKWALCSDHVENTLKIQGGKAKNGDPLNFKNWGIWQVWDGFVFNTPQDSDGQDPVYIQVVRVSDD